MKPILFNTEMVRAILDDRKSVTRRVVKPQPLDKPMCFHDPEEGLNIVCHVAGMDVLYNFFPPYQPGDILWVRETFRVDYLSNIPGAGRVQYKDGTYMDIRFAPERYDMMRRAQRKPGWRPNENMPREAARLFLRVTAVRVERLRESFFGQGDTITALRDEGIDIGDQCRQCIDNYGCPCCNDLDPELEPDENGEDENDGSECGMLDEVRSDFARLWDRTVKPSDLPLYGWEANPWTWVIEFERISKDEAIGGGGDGN